eukprot:11700707-Alexandrium_andersonii.AAC.1
MEEAAVTNKARKAKRPRSRLDINAPAAPQLQLWAPGAPLGPWRAQRSAPKLQGVPDSDRLHL